MIGHGAKFGRKKEQATVRTLEDRFGPQAETRFARRLRERIDAAALVSSQPETVYDRLIAANRIAQQMPIHALEILEDLWEKWKKG